MNGAFHDSWIILLVIRLSALVRLHYRMMCEMLYDMHVVLYVIVITQAQVPHGRYWHCK